MSHPDVSNTVYSTDSILPGFITSAEGILGGKCVEILRCVHSLAETANISPQTSLALALQTLDWLPTIPWDLSYCAGVPMMFPYGPELYELQSWSAAGDANHLRDSHTQAANLLSCKLAHMYNRVVPDDQAPAEQLHLPVQPHLILWYTHQPYLVPAPELHFMRPKWKGPTPAPHSALASRKLNQNLLHHLVVKRVMATTQHPKRAVRLMKMRPVLTAKPLGMGKAQTAEALTVKALAVAVRLQMRLTQRKTTTGKPKNPTARLKGQTLRAVPAPQKLMVRFQPEWPHQQRDQRRHADEGDQGRQPGLLSGTFTAQLGQQGY